MKNTLKKRSRKGGNPSSIEYVSVFPGKLTIMRVQNLSEHFPPSVAVLSLTLQNVAIAKIVL